MINNIIVSQQQKTETIAGIHSSSRPEMYKSLSVTASHMPAHWMPRYGKDVAETQHK